MKAIRALPYVRSLPREPREPFTLRLLRFVLLALVPDPPPARVDRHYSGEFGLIQTRTPYDRQTDAEHNDGFW